MKIPRSPGACADALYRLRERRLEAQRVVDALAADEAELKEHLVRTLPKSDATGISGRLATARVVVKEVPRVDDWDALRRYVVGHGAWEMLHRRVADAAVKERWDSGEEVPGVSRFKAVSVSVTRV